MYYYFYFITIQCCQNQQKKFRDALPRNLSPFCVRAVYKDDKTPAPKGWVGSVLQYCVPIFYSES